MTPKINVELHDHFTANRDRLKDHDWLAETLRPHCKIKRLGMRGSRLRIIQDPPEFAMWLILLSDNNVKSYLELGTSTGGSFFAVDSYLRAMFKDYRWSTGYDVRSKLRDWPQYQERFQKLEFRHQGSDKMDLGSEQYDACFIDARHEEKWVLQDFEKVKDHCRIVGFHDIALLNPATGRRHVEPAWLTIKEGRKSFEFINHKTPEAARCGIGVVIL
jgi:predicted O-methyltransferase YrrM